MLYDLFFDPPLWYRPTELCGTAMKLCQKRLRTMSAQRVLQNAMLAVVLALGSLGTGIPAHSAGSATSNELDRLYINARFGYSVRYPGGLLIPGPESSNGDGVAFRPERGTAEMRVSGMYNGLDQTPAGLAQEELEGCDPGKAPYEVVRPNLIVVSCERLGGRQIFYQETIIHGDVMTALFFVYPSRERAIWEPVVINVSRSLKGATDSTGIQGGQTVIEEPKSP